MVDWLSELFTISPILFCFASILLNAGFQIFFLSSFPITVVNIAVLGPGPIGGGLLTFIGEVTAAFVTYHVYNRGWRKFSKKIPQTIKPKKYIGALIKFRQQLLWIVFLRLIPFFPSSAVVIMAIYLKIGWLPFLWGSIIGKLPATIMEVLGALGLSVIFSEQLNIVMTIFIVGLLLYSSSKWLWTKKKTSDPYQADQKNNSNHPK